MTKVLNERPFGDPVGIKNAATEIATSVNAQLAIVAAPGWYDTNQKGLYDRMRSEANNLGDFESARQLIWLSMLDGRRDRLDDQLRHKLNTAFATKIQGEATSFSARSLLIERSYLPTTAQKALGQIHSKLWPPK
jgi:hypothetical protein